MKKIILTVCAFFFVTMLSAQGITTASAYFKTISEYYASLQDYEVDFEITIDKKETAGVLSYKAPELLRLDYSNPKDQVISVAKEAIADKLNGTIVKEIYVPNKIVNFVAK